MTAVAVGFVVWLAIVVAVLAWLTRRSDDHAEAAQADTRRADRRVAAHPRTDDIERGDGAA